jgi:hypothetical protein
MAPDMFLSKQYDVMLEDECILATRKPSILRSKSTTGFKSVQLADHVVVHKGDFTTTEKMKLPPREKVNLAELDLFKSLSPKVTENNSTPQVLLRHQSTPIRSKSSSCLRNPSPIVSPPSVTGLPPLPMTYSSSSRKSETSRTSRRSSDRPSLRPENRSFRRSSFSDLRDERSAENIPKTRSLRRCSDSQRMPPRPPTPRRRSGLIKDAPSIADLYASCSDEDDLPVINAVASSPALHYRQRSIDRLVIEHTEFEEPTAPVEEKEASDDKDDEPSNHSLDLFFSETADRSDTEDDDTKDEGASVFDASVADSILLAKTSRRGLFGSWASLSYDAPEKTSKTKERSSRKSRSSSRSSRSSSRKSRSSSKTSSSKRRSSSSKIKERSGSTDDDGAGRKRSSSRRKRSSKKESSRRSVLDGHHH